MSIKQVYIISFVGLMVGVLGAKYYQGSVSRKPSSLPAPQLKVKPWAHSPFAKMGQAIEVRISAVGGVPERDDQDLRLQALVTLNRPVDQEVKYQWVLPPEASVVSGELEDAWPNMQANQIATAEIVINGVSKESIEKTVTLYVSAVGNGVRYASSGSFATNSPSHMAQPEAVGVMNVQSSELALKKSESTGKIKKVHQ